MMEDEEDVDEDEEEDDDEEEDEKRRCGQCIATRGRFPAMPSSHSLFFPPCRDKSASGVEQVPLAATQLLSLTAITRPSFLLRLGPRNVSALAALTAGPHCRCRLEHPRALLCHRKHPIGRQSTLTLTRPLLAWYNLPSLLVSRLLSPLFRSLPLPAFSQYHTSKWTPSLQSSVLPPPRGSQVGAASSGSAWWQCHAVARQRSEPPPRRSGVCTHGPRRWKTCGPKGGGVSVLLLERVTPPGPMTVHWALGGPAERGPNNPVPACSMRSTTPAPGTCLFASSATIHSSSPGSCCSANGASCAWPSPHTCESAVPAPL